MRNVREQPFSHPGQCRRRAGGVPGSEQKLPAAQERPMEEQAVSLQPTGTTRSRSPHIATEEPMGQQWMGPEGAHSPSQPMDTPARSSPGRSCNPLRAACGGAGGQGGAAACGDPCGAVLEGWALWYVALWHGAMLEQCWQSCSLWEAYTGSVWERWHYGRDLMLHQGQRRIMKEQQRQSISPFSFLCII